MLLVPLDPTKRYYYIDIPSLARDDGLIHFTSFEDIQFWAKPFEYKGVMYFIKDRSYLAAVFQQLLKLYIVWRLSSTNC